MGKAAAKSRSSTKRWHLTAKETNDRPSLTASGKPKLIASKSAPKYRLHQRHNGTA